MDVVLGAHNSPLAAITETPTAQATIPPPRDSAGSTLPTEQTPTQTLPMANDRQQSRASRDAQVLAEYVETFPHFAYFLAVEELAKSSRTSYPMKRQSISAFLFPSLAANVLAREDTDLSTDEALGLKLRRRSKMRRRKLSVRENLKRDERLPNRLRPPGPNLLRMPNMH